VTTAKRLPVLTNRILVVAGSYYPEVGGGELLDQWHARLLREAGFAVEVLVAGDAEGAGTDPFGTPYRCVPARRLRGFRVLPRRAIAAALDAFAPCVLYLTGPHPHDGVAAAVARRRGIPTALLYHADFRTDRVLSRLATRWYARTIARRIDRICVTTQAYEQRLHGRGIARDRIAYVGMGVDVETFVPRDRYTDDAERTLLFVGRLDANHTYKRLDLLLEAMRALRQRGRAHELHVVGDGDRRAFFSDMAQRLELAQCVRFSGQLDADALRAAYRQADLLVLPSPTAAEGFGMVVLEALASGCPAVVGRAAGASEAVLESGCGGVWDGDSPDALAAALDRVLSDARPRGELATQARAYACQRHAWSSVGARLAQALEPLAAAGRAQEPAAR
jgi:glycosyltransferase involved in cell wall biosynthesis